MTARTVGELKELLAQYPDGLRLGFSYDGYVFTYSVAPTVEQVDFPTSSTEQVLVIASVQY
jgi:hypothetical protein